MLHKCDTSQQKPAREFESNAEAMCVLGVWFTAGVIATVLYFTIGGGSK